MVRGDFNIRAIQETDFEQVRPLPPPEWGTDLPGFLRMHHDQPYFLGWVVESEGQIIGFGNSLRNGITGWLGNILVAPEARGRGIGTAMTRHLMDDLRRQGCRRLLLVATTLGEPIYVRLGFRITGYYAFYRITSSTQLELAPELRLLAADDLPAVLALDRRISGETRSALLARFMDGGWVYDHGGRGGLTGYYLTGLATGPIISSDTEAGLALMDRRLMDGARQFVVPESNEDAQRKLEQVGAEYTTRAPRMAWGREAAWHPAGIFQRGAGWCG